MLQGTVESAFASPGQAAAKTLGRYVPNSRPEQVQQIEQAVAVGTRVSSRAPRTEPYVRLSRIRLPPRVCDGAAIARPRVEDDGFQKPVVRQLRHPCPGDPILLAAPP